MTTIWAALAMLAVTVGWFLLALLPALHEHFGRTDVGPLRVQSAAIDIRYFATSFQQFVRERLVELRPLADLGRPTVATLPDGSGVWYAPERGEAVGVTTVFDDASTQAITEGLVVICETSLHVPHGVQVLRELYASGRLSSDGENVFRAVLTGGDCELGAASEVLRWVNAGGALRVGAACTLWGRASCWGTMTLGLGTRFQRLAAPRIEFGRPSSARGLNAVAQTRMTPPTNAKVFASRWVVDGDLVVPDGEVIENDVIVSGQLRLGRGARMGGAVRGDMIVAADEGVFSGAVIAMRTLTLGAQCRIAGPVVVEGVAVFGAGCRIGDASAETTVTALEAQVGVGSVLCGEIWARRQAVVSAPASDAAEAHVAA